MTVSTRAQIITRRTYNRPLNEEGTIFETWEQTIDRVISHQKWLWERALTHKEMPEVPLHDITEDMSEWVPLNNEQEQELEELRQLMLDRKVAPAGRCFTGDTKVKLLDGTTPRFDELEIGKTYWAYGSTMDGRVVPVKAINNGITRTDTVYAKVTLDNNEIITCTIDHPFLTREGVYKEAQHLKTNDSLMPLYTRFNRQGYEEVQNNYTGEWIATHKLVAIDQNLPVPDYDKNQFLVIHHKDFNKHNNNPDNLVYMGDRDHFTLHSALGKENAKKLNDLIWHHPDYENFRKAKAEQCREMALDFWSNPKYEKSRQIVIRKSSERAILRNKSENHQNAVKAFRSTEEGRDISIANLQKANEGYRGIKVKLFKAAKVLKDLGLELNEANWNAHKAYKGAMGIGNIQKYFGSLEQFEQEFSMYNHTVKSVEIITTDTPINFYDFSVPRTVNFALASGVFVHNTLWLGGTDIGKKIELSQFNCCYVTVRTVHDIVDFFWGLLNGAGVTGQAEAGTLTGFRHKIPEIKIIRTNRGPYDKGPEYNIEEWDPTNHIWTIKIGDSAIAWAKSIGKLLAGKYPAKKLVLDFSNIRGAGARLRNYGWLSQSDIGLSKAYLEIFNILNARADCLLTEIDIGDIINLLGTVLSTRRAAEALLMQRTNSRWKEFVRVKQNIWENGKEYRAQSNNSILFYEKPTKIELNSLFAAINQGGNGEPGLVNAKHMVERAPWAKGLNP